MVIFYISFVIRRYLYIDHGQFTYARVPKAGEKMQQKVENADNERKYLQEKTIRLIRRIKNIHTLINLYNAIEELVDEN